MKLLKYIFTLILILVILLGIFLWQGIYLAKDSNAEEKSFLVKKGESVERIADNLEKEEIIRKDYFFVFYVLALKQSTNLIAGEYALSSSMNVSEIVEKIVGGDRVKKMITVIEGWTIEDIEDYLQMGEINPSLEGFLFPDTYEVFPEDKLEDILKKMRENFEAKITEELRNEIERQGKTLEDIIIMASILEKEVQTLEDKKTVAGVLWKRMDSGMLLQVDAIRWTYTYRGLPPSPICNPGMNSILAAIYPIETKYWFYLSSPEGETIFSPNFKEHQQAIEKYLR